MIPAVTDNPIRIGITTHVTFPMVDVLVVAVFIDRVLPVLLIASDAGVIDVLTIVCSFRARHEDVVRASGR